MARFDSLNPYNREAVPGSVLKIEDENYIRDTTTQRELFGYAISAKRYVLYNLGPDGTPDIRKPLEHGLGHLMNPLDPDSDDKEKWIETIWRYIVDCDVRHLKVDEPEWFALPAVSRIGVSNPDTLRLFDRQNRGKDYGEQVKPFNFMLSCQVAEYGYPLGVDEAHFHLVAPYERRPEKWLGLPWFDRHSGKRYGVTIDDASSREGIARIKTYGDVVESYRFHPEYKSVGPDGELSSQTTVGVLGRRPVEARRLRYVGKESNRLEEAQQGLIDEEDELLNEYDDPANDPFVLRVVPTLARMPRERRLAELAEADLHPRTLERVIAGGQRPHRKTRGAFAEMALRYARQELERAGIEIPKDDLDVLIRFLQVAGDRPNVCPICGEPVTSERATYCSARCRKRANRLRGRTK